jgi:hypothetical protein
MIRICLDKMPQKFLKIYRSDMYKQDKYFMFKNSSNWSVTYYNDFQTESEFNNWMSNRLAEGLVFICEKSKEVEIYPQVLRLDLKYSLGGYHSVIERFSSHQEYVKYCDDKLMQGYKVIGSEPYLKELEDATY